MAKSDDKVVRRGVCLYIDGKEINYDINSIQAEIKKLQKDIKGMTVGAAKTKLSEAGLSIIAYDKDGVVLSATDTTGFTASYYDKDGEKWSNHTRRTSI